MVDSLPKHLPPFGVDRASSYQKLLERIPDFAWLMNIRGQIVLANSSWQNYTGRVLSPSKPDLFWDWIQPEARLEIKQLWQNASVKRDVWERQLWLRNWENKYSLFNLQIEQLTEQNDNSSWFICTATPVSEVVANKSDFESEIADYKQKEAILIHQAEFIRRILESSKDCIKVLDLDGRLLYMNDGGQDLMEIDNFNQEVRHAPWLSFWQGCDRTTAQKAFTTACAGGIGRFDGYCSTAKGTPKWWEVVVTPMFNEDNEVTEILSVSRDITARKVAEQALQERNQELDRFTYVVSHDLKAPLRGINNLSEMIVEDLQEQIPDENQHQFDLLQQRVQRMNALIDGLLKYSRVGRQEFAPETVDVEKLLNETIDSLDPPKGFQITNTTPLPSLVTKRILLSQVLTNLISNAIKHHDRDRGQIDLTVKDCGNYYEFAIADDGPGIPEADRERIFEIFQTLENKTSTTNTGIGLALVKKIVLAEGGKFWLDPNSDRGCKFCFTWKK